LDQTTLSEVGKYFCGGPAARCTAEGDSVIAEKLQKGLLQRQVCRRYSMSNAGKPYWMVCTQPVGQRLVQVGDDNFSLTYV